MKRFLAIFALLIFSFFSLSCEKETILSVDQTSITIPDTGGSKTVSLTTNKPWTASSNQSWCKVSPSAGEEASSSRITITCDANTSYDARNASVTFTCAEKTVSVNVSQATNNGLIVSQTEYNITNAAQQLEIKVQANVKFSVEVENDCSDWVKLVSTKALKESTIVLEVSRNDSYEQRSGHITVRQTDGSLWNGAIIIQAPTSYLKTEKDSYTLSYLEQEIEIPVVSNTDFSIEIENGISWIQVLETKAMKEKIVSLKVEENPGEKRVGKVLLRGNDIMTEIRVVQEDDYYIIFKDQDIEACCLKYDTDGDGRLSYEEASSIKLINDLFGDNKHYKSFDEFRYFTGVTQIPTSMFENWDQLRKITIPDSVTEIGAYAFNRCTSLTEIHLSCNLKSIGTYAFSNTGFSQILLPDGLEEIDDFAFSNSKIESISVPGMVTTINHGVFQNNSYLKTVFFDDGVQSISYEAFSKCRSLDTVTFANSIKSIGAKAFYYCDKIRTIVFPDDLEYISDQAFSLCYNLNTVFFKDKLTYIGIGAFDTCVLTNLSIPASVKRIDWNAFPCPTLKRIDLYWTAPIGIPYGDHDPFYGTTCQIYVPKGSLEAYRNDYSWGLYGDRLIEREE